MHKFKIIIGIFILSLFAQDALAAFGFGTVSNGTAGQVSGYNATGTTIAPLSTAVLVNQGGTGAINSGSAPIANILGGTAQLPHWNAALAKVMTGLGDAVYACVGDSTTYGFYDLGTSTTGDFTALSYCNQLTQALKSAGIPASNESFFGAGGGTATRMVFGSGWASTASSLAGNYPQNNTTTNAAVFTPREPVDTFVLWYSKAPGNGSISYAVDAGGATTVSETAANAFTSVTISAGTLGMHTLNIARVSGIANFIGVIGKNSTLKQVYVYNWGWAGSTTGAWNSSTNPWSPGAACGTIAPDLASIDLGINDEVAAVTLPTYLTNLEGIASLCQTGGHTDILYTTVSHIDPAANSITEVTQATYAATVRTAATATNNSADFNGVPVVDFFADLVSFDFQKNVLGIQASGGSTVPLHLLASGYAIEARDLFQVLAPAGSGRLIQSGFISSFQTLNGQNTYINGQNGGYAANGATGNTSGGNIVLTPGTANGTAANGYVVANTPITTGGYTVANLPTGVLGMKAYVTDQLTTCTTAGAALTGGGSVVCPVFFNGSAWVGD